MPSAEELAFGRALVTEVEDVEFALFEDPSGPWLTVVLDVRVGALTDVLRLDFDDRGVEGGWSSSGWNADCGLRARHIGLPITSGDDYLMIPRGDLGTADLAREAAAWFRRVQRKHEG